MSQADQGSHKPGLCDCGLDSRARPEQRATGGAEAQRTENGRFGVIAGGIALARFDQRAQACGSGLEQSFRFVHP
jgi:hypothetical protein